MQPNEAHDLADALVAVRRAARCECLSIHGRRCLEAAGDLLDRYSDGRSHLRLIPSAPEAAVGVPADGDERLHDIVWGALHEVSEEELADACSAVLEGALSLDEFAERRLSLNSARARFDAAVDDALVGAGASRAEGE